MLDLNKAFDLINHHLLLEKLQLYDIPSNIIRLMATFLLPQRTLPGPKCFRFSDIKNLIRYISMLMTVRYSKEMCFCNSRIS